MPEPNEELTRVPPLREITDDAGSQSST